MLMELIAMSAAESARGKAQETGDEVERLSRRVAKVEKMLAAVLKHLDAEAKKSKSKRKRGNWT
jgi:hypothetical protein